MGAGNETRVTLQDVIITAVNNGYINEGDPFESGSKILRTLSLELLEECMDKKGMQTITVVVEAGKGGYSEDTLHFKYEIILTKVKSKHGFKINDIKANRAKAKKQAVAEERERKCSMKYEEDKKNFKEQFSKEYHSKKEAPRSYSKPQKTYKKDMKDEVRKEYKKKTDELQKQYNFILKGLQLNSAIKVMSSSKVKKAIEKLYDPEKSAQQNLVVIAENLLRQRDC